MRRNSLHSHDTIIEAEVGERGRIMSTTNHDAIVTHIKKVVQPIRASQDRVFHGVAGLKHAAAAGLLRKGQIIFGTVSAAHCEGLDNTQVGNVINAIAPVLTAVMTGQGRSYLFLHVAVYAGQIGRTHYVIENGGAIG